MTARRWSPALADATLAIVLTVLVQVETWFAPAPDPDEMPVVGALGGQAAGALAALVFTLSLAWRRRAPLLVLALAYPAMALARTASLDAAVALTLAVMVATYSAGAHTRGRAALVAAIGVVGLALLTIARVGTGVEEPSDVIMPLALLGGPWLAGLAIRERRDRALVLEERTIILERERAEQARTAVAEERARIAREMHDIVAHAMSVVVLQARGGRRTLTDDPAATRSALDAIEATGSAALAEMRGLLGVLGDGDARLRPEPGLADLEDLVSGLREAGLHVDVEVDGSPMPLPPSHDRAAYRIVQEALTNALRHAPDSRATVTLDYRDDGLDLTIDDANSLPVGPVVEGRGIAGMRERAASVGGRLDVTAGPHGGVVVHANLPWVASS